MRKHAFIVAALVAAAAPLCLSCGKENPESETPQTVTPTGNQTESKTLRIGCEKITRGGQCADTKTFVGSWSEVRWSGEQQDQNIYVWDSEGKKNTFTSNTKVAESIRLFSGRITKGSKVKLALWHGNTDDAVVSPVAGQPDACVISGSCLTLSPIQTVREYNSFSSRDNFSVLREGDSAFMNVFGYLAFRVPVSEEGYGTIKSVSITADEDLAGQVEIRCIPGQAPTARIVSGGSKTITVYTRWMAEEPAHYEPGLYFAVVPAGTYHNLRVSVTPADGSDPFTVTFLQEAVVERSKYTEMGTLPIEKTAATPGNKFGADYFETFTDPVSGVVSYRIKSSAVGWENSQSPYFHCPAMTDDERFIFFFVSANEWRPSYRSLTRFEQSAKILDLETRRLYTFYATNGCYPYLDPVNDKIYYFVRDDDKKGGRFYMRDLLKAPGTEVPLAQFPKQLLANGSGSISRACSHITLTQDKTKVFLDAWVSPDTFYQGLLDLYTGQWTEWSHNVNEVHLTHGQLNPTRDDEALLAVDVWDDSKGVHHSIVNDPDGEFNGAGTFPRIQIMKSDGSRRTIRPSDPWNGATHEAWHRDGEHVFWCCGMRFDKNGNPVTSGGTYSGGFHTRSIRDQSDYHYYAVPRSTHCYLSRDWFTNPDRMFAVHDDDRPYGPYTTGYYRGGPWKVWFYNAKTRKDIAIYSALTPIAMDPGQPSRLHPDPHPNLVAGDKYVICTAYGDDGNMHFSITPTDQLIEKSLH